MISKIVRQVIGSRNDRVLKEYRKTVQKINTFEPTLQNLSDEQLQQKTLYFKQEIKQGKTLEQILPEAFAVVREAGKRVLGMRHFDTQMLGGIALHQGKIAEMRTGEGKTLVATLPVYLNALLEKGVHVITVNDYLAQRDAKWMSQLYGFLGLSTGVNLSQMSNAQKRQAYACDITYGTNNEFGFDYLRDNLVDELEQKVQRIQFAIVDEVDSILIDEARTPLIISAPAEDSTPLYHAMNLVPPLLIKQEKEDSETGDFYVDEKAGQVHLSELGHEKVESIFLKMGLIQEGESLYDSKNMSLMHHLTCALRAHNLFFIDQQYVVQDDSCLLYTSPSPRDA
jgi:preprotein translocase subunit SecA